MRLQEIDALKISAKTRQIALDAKSESFAF